MFKNNYLAITTRKMRDGTKRENCFAVKLPKDMKVLRKQFGEDISNSSLTSKIYKNGVVYQNDKKSGISFDTYLLKISPVFANGAVDDRRQACGMQLKRNIRPCADGWLDTYLLVS